MNNAEWQWVPKEPTKEMWNAARSVPDPVPPYPPHYGLVWDAMLAASPKPEAVDSPQSEDPWDTGELGRSMEHAELASDSEPDAWGFPNSSVSGGGKRMMMVRLDIPSDDQYAGAFWVPLYAGSPPDAGRDEVLEEAAKLVENMPRRHTYADHPYVCGHNDAKWDAAKAIRAMKGKPA